MKIDGEKNTYIERKNKIKITSTNVLDLRSIFFFHFISFHPVLCNKI